MCCSFLYLVYNRGGLVFSFVSRYGYRCGEESKRTWNFIRFDGGGYRSRSVGGGQRCVSQAGRRRQAKAGSSGCSRSASAESSEREPILPS